MYMGVDIALIYFDYIQNYIFLFLLFSNTTKDLFFDRAQMRHTIHVANPTWWDKTLLLLYYSQTPLLICSHVL